MKNNLISVSISYKGSGLMSIKGFDEFQKTIKENYISNIRPDSRPQSGGMIDMIVNVLMDITLIDFLKIIRNGLIFNMVTRGKESYILKPLFDAFEKLEKANESCDYSQVRFMFDGTEIIINGMTQLFTSKAAAVINELSKSYHILYSSEL